MRKLVSAALVLFVGYFLVTQPDSAAGFVHQAIDMAHNAAASMSSFVTSL